MWYLHDTGLREGWHRVPARDLQHEGLASPSASRPLKVPLVLGPRVVISAVVSVADRRCYARQDAIRAGPDRVFAGQSRCVNRSG